VRNAQDAVVANQRVLFSRSSDTSLGSLSSALVTTDANGVAQITYTAGNTVTAVDGVQLKAQLVDDNGNLMPISQTVALTVAMQGSYVVLSLGNKLESDVIYYFQPASVSVLDATGQPAINQRVTLRVTPKPYVADNGPFAYAKGHYVWTTTLDGKRWVQTVNANCVNEDRNQNFQLDGGEDRNGNGILDPRHATSIIPAAANSNITYNSDGTVTMLTDSSGRVDVKLRYPKEYGSWATVMITANTQVAGTEATASRSLDLPVLLDDIQSEASPAFQNSPFGDASQCTNPK
jgi:hypothetical protein